MFIALQQLKFTRIDTTRHRSPTILLRSTSINTGENAVFRAQARAWHLSNLSMYVTSTSSRQEQTVCVHTAPRMYIRFSTIVEPVTPEHHATCPLTAASRGKLDIGKLRRAFVRARMWSRGPLHCSVMTLAYQNIFVSNLLATRWGSTMRG